jgi:molybdopterin converting factor small subunit
MSVKVKLSDACKSVMPDRLEFVEIEGGTVGDCFKDLITKYPQLEKFIYDYPGEMTAALMIVHNGLSISHDELDRPVKDGDEIFPLLIIGGG